jgi:DNA (cytosine-5)-methyltransferase 1
MTKEKLLFMKVRLGELFCGPGGLAWGAMNADIGNGSKIIHAWANDYDRDTCDTYIHNICPDRPKTVYCEDIRQLDMTKLSPIDALAFGFPCNDFSTVGKRKGLNGEYGPLYSYGVKALKLFKPKWFLAENVSGIKSANQGKAFQQILLDMQKAGYRIVPNLYKFEQYGVPQARHRIIIVGIRGDLPLEYKVPSTEPYKNVDVSVKHAIDVPPIADDAFNNERPRQSRLVTERLNHIKPGQNAFNADLPDRLKLKVKGAKISQIYRRLEPDKPAYTVTASGGGGTYMYHWSEPRALTNRERARLQTFPDSYKFKGNRQAVRKQIGMAVPCRGAKIIFEAILKTFSGIEYPYQEARL